MSEVNYNNIIEKLHSHIFGILFFFKVSRPSFGHLIACYVLRAKQFEKLIVTRM